MKEIDLQELEKIIKKALEEDMGRRGDITTSAIFAHPKEVTAEIVAKDAGIVAGIFVAQQVFRILDPSLIFEAQVSDGEKVKPGRVIARLYGDVHPLLLGERTALNFLQRLSGIATFTSKFVKETKPYGVEIFDTRKTTPALRFLEKYAVRVGGGKNHRFGLFDGILIKDNHIKAAGSLRLAVEIARKSFPKEKIEVEAETLAQVKEALLAGADIIMLDNMGLLSIRKAVKLVAGKAIIEVSGGVTLENVKEIARSGVDRISTAAITCAAPPLDMSLEIVVKRRQSAK